MTKLIEYLRSQATPYRGGRFLGRVSVDDAAAATGLNPYQVVMGIRLMEQSGEIESMNIGGADNNTAIYLVAA